MSSARTCVSGGSQSTSLTYHLVHAQPGALSHLQIFRLVQAGFLINDVDAMVGSSSLFRTRNLIERITGKSTRSLSRLCRSISPFRLDARQSAVAFQYARGLEIASAVFGSQKQAEQWLDRPCRQLLGIEPFEMLDISVGFGVVADYLERVRLGAYQ